MGITAGLTLTNFPSKTFEDIAKIESKLYEWLINYGNTVVVREYEKIVENFQEHKDIDFAIKDVQILDNEFGFTVYIANETDLDSRIFRYLDEGTDVRHAFLSEDWSSKTTPNSLDIGNWNPGEVLFIDPDVNFGGIEARNFTDEIRKLLFYDFNMKAEQKFNLLISSLSNSTVIFGKSSITSIYGSLAGGEYGSAWIKGISAEHRSALARAGGLARQAKRRAEL